MKIVDVAAAVVLGATGAGILALGLEIRAAQSSYADGIVTTATTTSFHTERTVNRRRTVWTTRYRPVYTFRTPTGDTTTYDDPDTVREPPQLGRSVKLSYRTNAPGAARVLRGWHGWTGFPILFTVAGTLVLACVVHIVTRGLIRDRADRRS
jgi:hypothetical protein